MNPPAPLPPVPTTQQLEWHKLEYYAFIHFSINTFTDKEWGYGNEDPSLFNPDSLNVNQWVDLFKEVGMKAVIITAKHHDGFCLWPSQFTGHSIKNSSYKNGEGDLLKELSEACRQANLKFGIYLSPWDRNHSDYGKPGYVQYYRNQLKEIFANYAPVFEMWFDGANGGDGYYGGANETRRIDGSTYYDWPGTIQLVREMEPRILFFSDAGPDIRWVGNERGVAGITNWNLITPDTLYAGKPDITELLNSGSQKGSNWIPAEVDVSIRPGWFYHETQNNQVKSPEELFEIYLTSVGRGSNLLLNVPPDTRGLIHVNDRESLLGFKKIMDETFRENKTINSEVTASHYRGNASQFSPEMLIDGNEQTYWSVNDEVLQSSITLEFAQPEKLNFLVIKETIALGQRIKKFNVEALIDNQWKQISEGTTIGYKRILKLSKIETNKLRLNILEARACPVISEIEVY